MAVFFCKMPRSKSQIHWQKQQAEWFRFVSWSHKLWCNCGEYMLHFKKKQAWDSIETGGLRRVQEDGNIRPQVVDQFIVRGGGDGFPGQEDIEDPTKCW